MERFLHIDFCCFHLNCSFFSSIGINANNRYPKDTNAEPADEWKHLRSWRACNNIIVMLKKKSNDDEKTAELEGFWCTER